MFRLISTNLLWIDIQLYEFSTSRVCDISHSLICARQCYALAYHSQKHDKRGEKPAKIEMRAKEELLLLPPCYFYYLHYIMHLRHSQKKEKYIISPVFIEICHHFSRIFCNHNLSASSKTRFIRKKKKNCRKTSQIYQSNFLWLIGC